MEKVVVIFALFLVSCAAAVEEDRLADIVETDGDPEAGIAVYIGECERCHGPGGNGDGIGPDLRNNAYTKEDVARFMLKGPFAMPTYSGYPDDVLADLAEFVLTL